MAEENNKRTLSDVAMTIVSIGILGGLTYVGYKVGEKSEKARYEGYQQGRRDRKEEETTTIHNVGRMIDREIILNRYYKNDSNEQGNNLNAGELNMYLKPRLTRFDVRRVLEQATCPSQKMTVMLGLVDKARSLYARGNLKVKDIEEIIGEINAHLEDISRTEVMTDELSKTKKLVEEDLADLRKEVRR